MFEQCRQAAILGDIDVTQQLPQLFAQNAVAPGFGRLASQAVHLSLDFRNDIGNAAEICARRFQASFRGTLADAKLGDPRCFFDDRAPVHRLGGENLTDAALLDDGVMTTCQTGPGKQILNIAQTARAIIKEIFAFARTIETARHRDRFTWSEVEGNAAALPPVTMMNWF